MEKIKYIRSDDGGSNWCSAKTMAKKIDLSVEACKRFLEGPELSDECALLMTEEQATLFSNTDLSQDAENI